MFQAVTSWELGPNGLLYDREWALVDADGRTLSQRRHSRLTQIRPLVDPAAGVCNCVTVMHDAAHNTTHASRSNHSRTCLDTTMITAQVSMREMAVMLW